MIAENVATPHSNTGSNEQPTTVSTISSHCDFLVVCGVGAVEEFVKAIWATFGTNFDWAGAKPGTRGRYYATILKSSQGIELAFTPNPTDATKTIYRLSIPGKPLQHARADQLSKLGRFLVKSGSRCTRFDWCIDDFNRRLPLDSIARVLKAGHVQGARQWRDIRSTGRTSQEQGRTIYIGSTQSERLVRIYDKEVESNAEIKSIRFEVQWRNNMAQKAFTEFFGSPTQTDTVALLNRYAVGSIRFYKPEKAVPSRCANLAWWENFVSRVGGSTKMSVSRLQTLISDKIHWVEEQVVGALAIISRVKGFDNTTNWLERIIRDKISKLSPAQEAYIQTVRDRLTIGRGDFDDWMVLQSWDKI